MLTFTPRLLREIEFLEYAVPLLEPLTTQNPQGAPDSDVRKGLLLVLRDADGLVGIGEIAPLAGLHGETLQEAEAQVRSEIDRIASEIRIAGEIDCIAGEGINVNVAFSNALFPSVRCGLEMAFIALQARQNGILPGQVGHIDSPAGVRVPLNALIAGKGNTLLARAEAAVRDGYTTLKIKVGRMMPDEDIAAVRACRQAVGKDIALRLDANRSWSLETALRVGEALQDCAIAYIEEPLPDWRDIPTFHTTTGIRVALDEMLYSPSASERNARNDIPSDCLAGYVLKPAALGSIYDTNMLASEANGRGLDAVVSSVFETGVALGFYAALASGWNGGHEVAVACGLDTYKFLAADVLERSFVAEQGFVRLPEVWQNTAHLQNRFLQRTLVKKIL